LLFSPVSFLFAVFNDLIEFDKATLTWTELSAVAVGFPPKPASSHGFVFANDRLFMHGRTDANGKILIMTLSA
jgi:hypothetical protein